MSSTLGPHAGAPLRPGRAVPRRGLPAGIGSDRLIGGVAAGIARRLGASALVVRVAFVVLFLAGGLGAVVYAALWFLGPVDDDSPGRPHTLRHDLGVVAATAAGLVTVFEFVPSVSAELVGPLALVAFAWAFSSGPDMGADLSAGRAFGRLAVGAVLMLFGLFAGVAALGDLGQIWVLAAATAAVLLGGAVVFAPWLRRLIDGASADRIERIRAEERADIAAHLHDSVLQTLTLIQNRSHEPAVTSALAHQQERDLRRWLYEQTGGADTGEAISSLGHALARTIAEVEDDYLVVVDAVTVGDVSLTPTALALLGAMREALVNAAKFADTPRISAFVEVDAHRVVGFVRDRGVGFEPDRIAADRRGITDSVVARVERVGGQAVIRSAPGAGTEVRVEVPR